MNDRHACNRDLKDAWQRRQRDALIASIPLPNGEGFKQYAMRRAALIAVLALVGELVLPPHAQAQGCGDPPPNDTRGIVVLWEKWKDADFRQGREAAIMTLARNRGVLKLSSSRDRVNHDLPTACYCSLDWNLDFIEGDFEPAIVPASVDDELLAETLPFLPELEEVRLPYTLVTDAGLRHLAVLVDLRKLELIYGPSGQYSCDVGDVGMEALSEMQSLQELSLACVPISDDGLARLASLENLECLSIWSMNKKLTSNVFCHFSRMKRLKSLTLCFHDHNSALENGKFVSQFPRLEDNVPQAIAALDGHLQTIHLGGSVHPDALTAIGRIDSLKSLDLQNTNVTSELLGGIIRDLDRPLESLTIPRSSVGAESAAALRRKWPKSVIVDHESVTWKELQRMASEASARNSDSD